MKTLCTRLNVVSERFNVNQNINNRKMYTEYMNIWDSGKERYLDDYENNNTHMREFKHFKHFVMQLVVVKWGKLYTLLYASTIQTSLLFALSSAKYSKPKNDTTI